MGVWTRGNDWGGYEYNVRNVDLHDEGECAFFISQAGGLGTPALLKAAREAGQIAGTYYWNSALKAAQFQIDEFSKLISKDKPDIIWIDFEHWWKDWTQHDKAIKGEIPWSEVERLPAQKISDNAQFLTEGIVQRWAGKYILVYSADWFIKGYCPQAVNWVKEYPFCVASYPDYGVEPYEFEWQKIRDWKFTHRLSGELDLTEWQPTLPVGINSWDMWQYSSRIKIPGEQFPYDWVVFDGSLDDLKVKCGLKEAAPKIDWASEITAWARRQPDPYTGPDPE